MYQSRHRHSDFLHVQRIEASVKLMGALEQSQAQLVPKDSRQAGSDDEELVD